MEAAINNRVKDTLQGNENLMRMLDRGIDDMEAGREFPLSIIFYVVKEPENEIHILRVLREERDWGRILKEKQEYTYLE